MLEKHKNRNRRKQFHYRKSLLTSGWRARARGKGQTNPFDITLVNMGSFQQLSSGGGVASSSKHPAHCHPLRTLQRGSRFSHRLRARCTHIKVGTDLRVEDLLEVVIKSLQIYGAVSLGRVQMACIASCASLSASIAKCAGCKQPHCRGASHGQRPDLAGEGWQASLDLTCTPQAHAQCLISIRFAASKFPPVAAAAWVVVG